MTSKDVLPSAAGEDPDPKSLPAVRGIRRVPLWCWWILLVFAISIPWDGFMPGPLWARVHWVPFTDPIDNWVDVLANIALFVPFGYSFAAGRRSRARAVEAVLAAAAVSIAAEATQLFSTTRYPSMTDVTSAILGALVGATLLICAPTFMRYAPSKVR